MADENCELRYGKPLKHTPFKKGRSGNAKGAPKGFENAFGLMRKILEAKVIGQKYGRKPLHHQARGCDSTAGQQGANGI
jgi:hypothetical protein